MKERVMEVLTTISALILWPFLFVICAVGMVIYGTVHYVLAWRKQ